MDKKYPMTYEEFEKRVSELFLAEANSPSELMKRKRLLRREVGLIKSEYNSACYDYDDPERSNNQFTDEKLKHQAVRVLGMV